VTIESLVRRLSVLVIVFFLTLSSTIATVHAAENPRKMTECHSVCLAMKAFFGARQPVQRKSSQIGSGVTR
jgi:hypothetical protein